MVCVAQKIRGIHDAPPPQNWEHGANAFDLGDNADVCVVASSSAVVAAGHNCGRDGLKPLGFANYCSNFRNTEYTCYCDPFLTVTMITVTL